MSEGAFVTCPTCGSAVTVYTGGEGTSSYEPVALKCSACFKPMPDPSAACECGNSTFIGTVTLRG